MLRRVHKALAARCSEVILVGSGSATLKGVRKVADERAGGQGPLAGMEAGLAAARNRLVFVAAGDLPFLPEELVGFLLERLEERGACAAVPRHEGRTHPLCAAYERRIVSQVRSLLDGGTRSVRELLGDLDPVYYAEEELRRFGDPELFLMNVNAPQDLGRARREAAP